MRRRIIFAILVTGFSGIVGQILLLRELLVTYYGNELSIGLILANWLILEAVGCFFVGRRIEGLTRKVEALVGLLLIFSFFLPLSIYCTRILKTIMGITPGEGLGLLPILCSSFFLLFPVSLPHGALFTFSCRVYSLFSKEDQTSIKSGQAIGRVYVYETLGTIAGGVALTYLLIPHFHSLEIAFGIGLLNFIACVWLMRDFWQGKPAFNKFLGTMSWISLVLFASFLLGPKADEIHRLSISQQWKHTEVLHYQNSLYGNIAVTKSEEQYTFLSDGIPIVISPTPDITFVEEFTHLTLLSHPQPREVLIISGGAGGIIKEVLKYPVERIDYVELDPLILEVIKEFPTPLTQTELSDPRVKVKYIDGRLFIKKTSNKYDLVLVGLSEPSTLQINRLFTKEFFTLVEQALKDNGILAITMPGSLTYLSQELKDLNGCILNTLKDVFAYTRVIPGDFNLFLASTSPEVSRIDSKLLSQRLEERELEVSLLTPAHLEYRLHPRWLDWFFESLEGATEKVNRDFSPSGVFYSLSYWNAIFSPYMRPIFKALEKITIRSCIFLLCVFTLTVLFITSIIKRLSRTSIPFCIATTGLAGMMFDLVLIFAFQSLYGYVYYQIGLLVTAFMAGTAVGGLVMTRSLARIKKDLPVFFRIEFSLIIFSLLLPAVFVFLGPRLARPAIYVLLQIVFLALSFLSGLLVGFEFPLANKIYLTWSPSPSPLPGGERDEERISPPPREEGMSSVAHFPPREEGMPPVAPFLPRGEGRGEGANLSTTAGLLYGADLFGGWIGGIIGAAMLLSLLGLVQTCMLIAILKASSLIILKLGVRS